MDYVLSHHGIKGMKWGVRRTDAQLARAGGSKSPKTKQSKPPVNQKVAAIKNPPKSKGQVEKPPMKKVSEMSDDELRRQINRLDMEKRYKELTKQPSSATTKKGKEFALDVLAKSSKTVMTQASTHYMGKLINKLAGEVVVKTK